MSERKPPNKPPVDKSPSDFVKNGYNPPRFEHERPTPPPPPPPKKEK
jgi:hypothetical protein